MNTPSPTPPRPAWQAGGLDARSFHTAVLHLTVGGGSERPITAVRVLSALFALLPPGTTKLTAGRAEIALEAHCSPADASRALSDLVRLGLLIRSGEGKATRYAFDPSFAEKPAVPKPTWWGAEAMGASIEAMRAAEAVRGAVEAVTSPKPVLRKDDRADQNQRTYKEVYVVRREE